MSVSKFFAPYCIKPIYLLESEDKAGSCGFINGLVYSFIFTIAMLLGGAKFYMSEKDSNRRGYIIHGVCVSIALLWVLFPTILYYSYQTMWRGYDDSKRDLQRQGYTKMEILNILQLFEQKSASLNVGGLSGGMIFAGGKSTSKEDKQKYSSDLLKRNE